MSRIHELIAVMDPKQARGEPVFGLTRAWTRAIIDKIEVDDAKIRIHGRRTVLERLVMRGGAPECPVLF